jgi:adenosylmethionine-8-amino-7-oxononanoate aminotransferase
VLACRHWGVEPDLVATGKGLGAGYAPIAACLVAERVLDVIRNGSGRIHGGHTYSGNPLSAAAALAVLDVLEDEDLVRRAAETGATLRDGLDALASAHPVVADVRGVGMLLTVELLGTDRSLPVGELSRRCAAHARERGLLLYPTTGGFNDALLVAPPLTITPSESAQLLARLDQTLLDLIAPRPNA